MTDASKLHTPEVAPIRAGEEFDKARVAAWLKAHVDGLEGPMEVLQFPGGHANLTYLARFGDRELVLRRPPLGPVAPKSHDMGREYKVLKPLCEVFPYAPRAYAFCDDPEVMGAIFIVMERCEGVVVRNDVPEELARHPDARRRMSWALVDAMADLHDVDYDAIGLSDLGKPDGFVERQVHGWKGRWDQSKDVENPLFDEIYDWLVANLPQSVRYGLVHNDLKLDNVMLDPQDPGRVVAILDWDMTTLGDPLVDLGTLLCYWAQADDGEERSPTQAITAQPGFPTRAEVAERYAKRRNLDVSSISYYEAFGLWKTAVVLQQIYIRWVRGQTKDDRFKFLGTRVPALIEIAAKVGGLRT